MQISNIHLFVFPVNLIIGAVIFFVAVLEVIWSEKKGRKSILASPVAGVTAIAAMLGAALVLGFCRRQGVETVVWSWPFAIVIVWFLLSLVAVVVARVRKTLLSKKFYWSDCSFLLMHAGLWLTVFALYFGSCDKYVMTLESVLKFWNIAATVGIVLAILGACLMLKEVKR